MHHERQVTYILSLMKKDSRVYTVWFALVDEQTN